MTLDMTRTPASVRFKLPAVVLSIGTLTALSTAAIAQTPPLAVSGVVSTSTSPTPEVSTAELMAILAAGSAHVFDARPTAEFAVSHIPGALNVAQKPGTDLAEYISDANEVDRIVGGNKGAAIVLYCNGPFCGKSKRLATDLKAMGYTNVKRYQLGAPTWRALTARAMVIEAEAVERIYRLDGTARFIDARPPCTAQCNNWKNVLPGSVNIQLSEVAAAKDDGRTRRGPQHAHRRLRQQRRGSEGAGRHHRRERVPQHGVLRRHLGGLPRRRVREPAGRDPGARRPWPRLR